MLGLQVLSRHQRGPQPSHHSTPWRTSLSKELAENLCKRLAQERLI